MTNHFLALRPTVDTAERLIAICDRLRAWDLPAQWTQPADFHITIAFLGPLDADEAHLIPSAIDEVVTSFRQPALELVGTGARAGRHEPRAVFAALQDKNHLCRDMHDDIMHALGLTPDSAFTPHITLCRPLPNPTRHHQNGHKSNRTWQALFSAFGQATWGNCVCEELALYKRKEIRSETKANRYDLLTAWRLIK